MKSLSLRSQVRRFSALAAASLALSVSPEQARACGGFFCSSSPIDQTAEHILFTVNGDHTVTAVVQIQYKGDRDAFAWIVPAPGIPTLAADFPNLALTALDSGTQPQYRRNSCFYAEAGLASGAGGATGALPPSASNGVTVLARQAVGPFDTVTLEGTSADLIVTWLQKNGYRITKTMVPLLQPYVEGGMHFVAMRLQADKNASDIQPLTMTYDSDKPMIPIRLTSVAAQPEMGVVTWVLSNQRFAPENYVDLKISDKLIEFDQYGNQSNYLTVVSREADKVGGQAFVTEYARSTADLVQQVETQPVPQGNAAAQKARDMLLPLLKKFPYITRLYARMSAEEMTEDPIFMPSSNKSEVSNIHDLTDPNFDQSKCNNPPPPDPCLFTYCGRSGVCVSATATNSPTQGGGTSILPACVCATAATARSTTTSGQLAMYCEPIAMNLDVAGAAGAAPPLAVAACEGFDCGPNGTCAPMNGNPSCQCKAGYGAVGQQVYDQTTGTPSTTVTCVKVASAVPPLPTLPKIGQAQLSPDQVASRDSGGCAVTPRGPQGSRTAALLAGIGALALAARRRQRLS